MQCHAQCCPVSGYFLLLICIALLVGQASPQGGSTWNLKEALKFCEGYKDLNEIIDKQLSVWKPGGIERQVNTGGLQRPTYVRVLFTPFTVHMLADLAYR